MLKGQFCLMPCLWGNSCQKVLKITQIVFKSNLIPDWCNNTLLSPINRFRKISNVDVVLPCNRGFGNTKGFVPLKVGLDKLIPNEHIAIIQLQYIVIHLTAYILWKMCFFFWCFTNLCLIQFKCNC